MGRDSDQSGTDNSANSPAEISRKRRKFLTAAGATMAAGLAGCGGDQTGDGTPTDEVDGSPDPGSTPTPTDTEGGVEQTDTVYRVYNTDDEDLSNQEVNKLNPRYSYTWTFWFHMHGAGPSPTHSDEYLEGFEESYYDPDNNEYILKIRDNILWHQGSEIHDEFTIEDIMWNWRINHHEDFLNIQSPQVENVTTPDDKTMVFEMSESVHTQGVDQGPPLEESHGGSWTYRNGPVVSNFKEYQDASTESEKTELRDAIINHSMPTDGTAITAGPWYVENASPQQLDLRRVPGHFLTESEEWNNNWTRARIEKVTGSGNVEQQGLNQDLIDYANDGPPANVDLDSIPDHITTRLKMGQQGRALQINYAGRINDLLRVEEGNAVPRDVAKIRQGIAYALNNQQAVRNLLGQRVEQVMPWMERTHFGAPAYIQEYYPDLWDALPSYGPGAKPDMAAEAFQEGGLTMENGTWMTPDGEPFELNIQTWSSNPEIAVTAESNLNSVGVDASVQSMDDTTFVNNLFESDYGVVPSYFYFANVLPDIESVQMLSTTGNSWAWRMHQPPGLYDIPEIGDMNGDTVETLDADAVETEIQTSGLEEHAEVGKKVIWAAAYHLPNIPLFPGLELDRFNETHFTWPGPSEKYYTASEDDPISTGIRGRWSFRGFPEQTARTE